MHLHSTKTVLGLKKHPGLASCAPGLSSLSSIWLHWRVSPPRAWSWSPGVLPSLPSGAGHPELFGVSKPAIPHQHWDEVRETTGVTEKTEELQNPKITRLTKLPELASLKFSKSLYYSLRNRRCQNISWKPHTKSQTRLVLGELLEAWLCSPKMPDIVWSSHLHLASLQWCWNIYSMAACKH